jgi:hypothetical protein
VEQLLKKSQFLVHQSAKLNGFVLSCSLLSYCLQSFQAFVLSRIKRNRIKKSTELALKESRSVLVLKVKTLFYCFFVQTKMRMGGRICVYNVYLPILRVSGRGADNLKYFLHKWRLLVCDVSCSIPAVGGTIHLESRLPSSVKFWRCY